ncbi:MAG: B12-binding domain-containing radical SAM protein [Thaumarchaeota archaeon]|nr:B12-binding domain-containing radical SAM protein [Nitrososphaerota archaeon]
MKVLLIVPEIRLDNKPYHFPFWAGILAAVAERNGMQVGILDLNALRDNFKGNLVPNEVVAEEISLEKWDLIGIGGLTSTYARIKQLVPIIRKSSPDSILLAGGGWSTYNPDEILQLVPEIDMICIGEGEETFAEICDEINSGTRNFDKIRGLCLNNKGEFKFTEPRALISDLDTVPYPAYHLMETEIYYKYSSLPLSVDSYNSKRRASVVWERGCPRGCTFCSHNGMSRGDLQNIYGKGDRREGEKLVRISDKMSNTFQLPARWPTPKYAVENIKFLKEKYDVDFISILDENMTSNLKWTKEFCRLYVEEGLEKTVKWGTLGDAPSVAVKPSIVQTMKDAGCAYISFGFESASNKVLNQDIGKGQLQIHEQQTIDTVKKAKLTPLATFMIGNPHENINDLMETVTFWIRNNIEVDPFICTPYVGSPLFFDYKDFLLQQYDERLKMIASGKYKISDEIIKKLKLRALDKFMQECGDATQYTATVSQYFSIPELYALKRFMYKKDTRRMLQMAHQRYEQTGLEQWKHDEEWAKYCNVCKAQDELGSTLEVPLNR